MTTAQRATWRQRFVVARAKRGLTQLDVSVDANLPLARYWRIEHGYRRPTPAEAARLSRVLGIRL